MRAEVLIIDILAFGFVSDFGQFYKIGRYSNFSLYGVFGGIFILR